MLKKCKRQILVLSYGMLGDKQDAVSELNILKSLNPSMAARLEDFVNKLR